MQRAYENAKPTRWKMDLQAATIALAVTFVFILGFGFVLDAGPGETDEFFPLVTYLASYAVFVVGSLVLFFVHRRRRPLVAWAGLWTFVVLGIWGLLLLAIFAWWLPPVFNVLCHLYYALGMRDVVCAPIPYFEFILNLEPGGGYFRPSWLF